MVGINDSTKKKHMFYNSKVQAISIGVGDCATEVGALCANFFDMGASGETQVGNIPIKLFNFWG